MRRRLKLRRKPIVRVAVAQIGPVICSTCAHWFSQGMDATGKRTGWCQAHYRYSDARGYCLTFKQVWKLLRDSPQYHKAPEKILP